jgi:aminomethyltransferase
MTLPPDVDAIRTGAGYSRSSNIALVALRDDHARDALLHVFPSRLFLRDAQVKESLLLAPDGLPLADVLVCADDEDYILLVEGMTGAAVRQHMEMHLPASIQPTVDDLEESHEVVSLHGPWAWWLAAKALGDDLVSLPYLSFFRVTGGICVRAGKTGEYGYDIVVTRETAGELWSSIARAAAEIDAREVAADALSICRFENWFFDPAFVPDGVTPVELGLSWRLDMEREWIGKSAVEGRWSEGRARRLTCLVSGTEVVAGDHVRFGDRAIGSVVRAERSPARDEWIVAAMVDVAYSHGGIDCYRVGELDVPVLTVAPPLIDNRSLYVDPRRHTWESRDEIELGPLVRGPRAKEHA